MSATTVRPLRLFAQGLNASRPRAARSAATFFRTAAFTSRPISTSPFHRLLARHAERPSVRRILSSLRNGGATRRLFSSAETSATKAGSSTAGAGADAASEASLSLSQRLRKLSREYGWSAFGVYMALTALDFPFCFLAVRWLGTERIGRWEHIAVEWIKRAVPFQLPERWGGKSQEQREAEAREKENALYDHGVKEAEEANQSDYASLWTQLVLAYAIHKSFIFVRVPLTAAITPKVVKTLRGWGWNIGKRTPKAEREAKKARILADKEAGPAAKAAREALKRAD